jgi:hypothetical protein
VSATPLEKVLTALDGQHKPSGNGYTAKCPAHDDHAPSLSIAESEDGKVLLNCHAGCSSEKIVGAMGLTMSALFPDAPQTSKNGAAETASSPTVYTKANDAVIELERKFGKRSAWWTYRDANGNPVAAVVRWDTANGKTFRPVAKIGTGWRIGDPEGLWPLYQLPAVLKSQGRVYICEGEKAADAVTALGLAATTSAHGAKAADKTDWSPLAGRTIVILPDHDEPGARYAEDVATLLARLNPAPTIKIVNLPDLPPHGDAVEYVADRKAAGLDAVAIGSELNRLADVAEVLQPTTVESASGPVLVSLADVEPEPVKWLWPGRIALGKLTLLAGDPGVGKSFVTLDIAARVSRGRPWADAPSVPICVGGAVLLNAEDDAGDTIRPRFDAAGGDVGRVLVLEAVRRRGKASTDSFCLKTDVGHLETAIRKVRDCRLVVIDPISAYLGRTDSHNNAEVRELMAPLAALAAKYSVAVILVTHFNKGATANAIYRAMGSIAFAAASRAVWCIVKDKQNPRRRLFLPLKNNLGGDALGLAYAIGRSGPGGAPVVVWEKEPVTMLADEVLAIDVSKASQKESQAEAWLREALKDGPRASTEVLAEAKDHSFGEKLIRRVFERLGGSSTKADFHGGWLWSLPDAEDGAHEDGTDEDGSHVERESWESSEKNKGFSNPDGESSQKHW